MEEEFDGEEVNMIFSLLLLALNVNHTLKFIIVKRVNYGFFKRNSKRDW